MAQLGDYAKEKAAMEKQMTVLKDTNRSEGQFHHGVIISNLSFAMCSRV